MKYGPVSEQALRDNTVTLFIPEIVDLATRSDIDKQDVINFIWMHYLSQGPKAEGIVETKTVGALGAYFQQIGSSRFMPLGPVMNPYLRPEIAARLRAPLDPPRPIKVDFFQTPALRAVQVEPWETPPPYPAPEPVKPAPEADPDDWMPPARDPEPLPAVQPVDEASFEIATGHPENKVGAILTAAGVPVDPAAPLYWFRQEHVNIADALVSSAGGDLNRVLQILRSNRPGTTIKNLAMLKPILDRAR